jgi:hypothetical protein
MMVANVSYLQSHYIIIIPWAMVEYIIIIIMILNHTLTTAYILHIIILVDLML